MATGRRGAEPLNPYIAPARGRSGYASGAGREALAAALTGAVGDAAGIELLSYVEHLDLPDPDRVLADPDAFDLPERGDRQLAFLIAVVAAVQGELTRPRWEAGWAVLAEAVDAGVPDVAARAATDPAAMCDLDWPVPAGIDGFVELLQLSGALPGGAEAPAALPADRASVDGRPGGAGAWTGPNSRPPGTRRPRPGRTSPPPCTR